VAGLTGTGLSIKRLQDIRDEITTRLTGFFGEGINTTEDSVFGQVRDSVAPGESSVWEQLQIVYDSQFPSRAEGQQLDDNCAIVGVFRGSNTPTLVTASITGANNSTIPIGYTVAINTTQEEFVVLGQNEMNNGAVTAALISVDTITNSTTYTVTIDSIAATYNSDASATEAEIVAGLIAAIPIAIPSVTAVSTINSNEIQIASIDETSSKEILIDTNISFVHVTSRVPMKSKNFGPILAPANQLIDIKTFISGVTSATNVEAGVLGTIEETDTILRERRDSELSKTASTGVNAIAARINLVDDVRSTVVLENYTDSVDGNGLNPHSIQAIVDGGLDADIAAAIFDSKPVGTDMNGAESVAVVDSMGISRNVLFDRPTLVPIYIEVTLTKFGTYPSNGDTQIKESLVQFGLDNLFAGDDVITSRLYTPVNSIQGHQVDSLFISTSVSPTVSTPITITLTQLAQISLVNITIV